MAVGDIPEDILDIIKLGRVTALQKPDGHQGGCGGRPEEVGCQDDRENECRKRRKQPLLPSNTHCPPKQVAHILQTLTEVDEGIGAYVLIFGNAMLQRLFTMEKGDGVLSFF